MKYIDFLTQNGYVEEKSWGFSHYKKEITIGGNVFFFFIEDNPFSDKFYFSCMDNEHMQLSTVIFSLRNMTEKTLILGLSGLESRACDVLSFGLFLAETQKENV